MRTILWSLLVVLFSTNYSLSTFAQSQKFSNNPWEFTAEPNLKDDTQVRQIVPLIYQTAKVDLPALKSILNQAPQRFSAESISNPVILTLPMPDGGFERFEIQEASIMHPDLAAKFPEIKSYSGNGIDDPTAFIRFDLTPKGFHAMIRSGHHSTAYIDPYAVGNTEDYVVYFRKDFAKIVPEEQVCLFDEYNPKQEKFDYQDTNGAEFAGDCDLRTFRLALACTGEYATFHGGTVAGAMAAMNTSMVRVNGIFEQDAAITMILVPNNDQLIYLNASTDPYTNNNGGTMLGENIATCNSVIGSANYDIGHVFSTGGGGVAYLQSPCGSNKAGGVTGSGSPVGDPFDVDYVAHEMGHQYGANHTQNNSCNRNSSTAMEPGSASTIMGYAGICSPNVQNNSDDHFHGISLQEMGNFLVGNNSNCALTTVTGNNQPTVNGGSNYTIPGGTKFMLTATANDADGNGSLTYCWEQFDNEVGSMPPSGTNTVGPMFRSISPSASPTRFFPNINAIVNNLSPTWEVLPTVDRTMDFRVTVRDNNPGAGCTEEDDVTITVDGNTGPFVVTAPNTNVTWAAGSTQTVTWNVAGTTAAPVNAANVDILLSTDGGFTYPITLLTNVTNDGSQAITVPNNPTTTARIMVRGSNNVFFDISNQNFTIDGVVNDFFLAVTPTEQTVCQPLNATYSVAITSTGTFSGNVQLSATGVPAGATANFSPSTINTSGNSTLTIGNTGAVAPGNYSITINASGSTGTKTAVVNLTVAAGAPNTVTLTSPANGATGVSTSPTLSWNAATGATSYEVQVSTNANFSSIAASGTVTGTSYTVMPSLMGNTNYFWRVRGASSCGTGAYSTTFSFTTANETCNNYVATNVPITISSSGTPTITSTLTINDSGTISDLNLNNLNVTHSWLADLTISLTSPSGTTVTVINQICGQNDNIDINLDDEASNNYASIPCPPTDGGNYQPNSPLSAFDGEEINGTWTLTITDDENQDGGSLDNWELFICYESIVVTPLSVSASATDESCFGFQDGTASAVASGGTGNYTYTWSNGMTGATISNLTAGNYTVSVSDGSSTASASVTVGSSPAINIAVTGNNLTCNGNSSGSATATATGGVGGFTYAWSNGGSGSSINNLAAGNYTVTVFDSNQCSATGSVTITQPAPLGLGVSTTDAVCAGNNGSATATVTGGTGNVTYAWSNGATGATINNLAPGNYSVTATDGNQCTDISSFTIGQSGSNLSVTATATNSNCTANNGTAVASANGGTGTISYTWSNGDTGSNISNLAPGSYTVTATDANGCSGTASVQVNQIGSNMQVSTSTNDASCGASDGSATATAFGGTGNILYNWNNGGTGQTITGLAAGTYTVTATDANGCTATATAVVGQAGSDIQVMTSATDANCTSNNGTATASATGGSGSYSYAWSNNQTGSTIGNLAPGTYTVVVTDGNGCTGTGSVQVGQAGSNLAVTASATDASCDGNDGTASAAASGGAQPISFSWSNGDTGANINGLAPGNYTVVATDANGCTATATVTVNAPAGVEITTTSTPVSCFGGSDGTAAVSIQGGTSPYVISWSNGSTTNSISNLTPGQYQVMVSDANNCVATAVVIVSEPSLLSVNVSGTNANGGNNGSATATVAGGTPPYSYLWNTQATTSTINNLAPAVYSVVVTDGNGCTASGNIVIEDDTPPVDDYCLSGGENTAYEWIENVNIANVNNTSGNNDGYGNFTALTIELVQGNDANVVLTPGFASTIYEENWAIWIDFNQDGDFADAGEEVFGAASTSSVSGIITVPFTSSIGQTRMRIAMKWGGLPSPCEFFSYGEVEDYTVNITENNGGGGCTEVVVNTNDFEAGWGIWIDGGSDCRRSINDAPYANSGDYCIQLRDNTGSSTMTTQSLNLSSFEEVTVDFTYITRSMDNANEDFWLQISTDGGQFYNTVEEWNLGDEFVNGVREFDAVTIAGPFSTNTRFRFRCDASSNTDWVYIDDVTISGCTNLESSIFDQDALASTTNSLAEGVENTVTATVTNQELQLSVFPNPVSEKLTVNYQLPTAGNATLAIFDLTGKLVLQQPIEAVENMDNQLIINVQSLNEGYYYLRIIGEKEHKAVKFLKF